MGAGESAAVDVPTLICIQFGHASVQRVADRVGADVLHIKGAALDPGRNPGRSFGTDADVLVRPEHVRRFVAALPDARWSLYCDFDEGSLFEHAASFSHPSYGMLDVHQVFPGLHADPRGAFERLWADREVRRLANVDCAVPGRLGERLILLLHAARTPGRSLDVSNHWGDLDDAERAEVRSYADQLHAQVGLALAIGEEDRFAVDPELELWRRMIGGGDRLGEWVARFRAAPGAAARLRLVARAARVNRFVLAERLGHRPSPAEVRREWWRRSRRGVFAALGKLRRRP
jgi:hypothetical protein